jgi:hypothetical protein
MPIVSDFRRGGAAFALACLTACRTEAPPVAALREVPVPAAPGAGEPFLAITPGGLVLVSWLEPAPDGAHALRIAALADTAWSAPLGAAVGRGWFVNWADFPSITALDDTTWVVHRLVRRGAGYAYDVHVARTSDAGVTWSAPVVPHTDGSASEHGFVTLWPAGGHRVAAVWLDGRKYATAPEGTGEMTLRYATLGPGGDLADEVELDPRTCDCCQTDVARTAAGPVVVYRDRSADEIRDIQVVRFVNGAWTEPSAVAADGWRLSGCPVNGPTVAAEGQRVVVAWYTAAGGQQRVHAAFSDDAGATFGSRIIVDGGRPIGRTDVVLDGRGAALVSWMEEAGDAVEIRVRRVTADGRVGSAMTIARVAAGRASGFPRMVRSGDRLVFAWTEPGAEGPSRVRAAVGRLPR